jgi:C4-dicarboxylate transporter, DctQ subunit
MKTLGAPFASAALEKLGTFFSCLLGGALIVAVIVNVLNVVARHAFSQTMTGADDLEIYLMIAMAFLGGLVAHIRRCHLRMDVLSRRFPLIIGRLVDDAEALLAIAVCGLMSCISCTYTFKMFNIGSYSENAHIPMWIPHAVLAIAFTLMTLAATVGLLSPNSSRPRKSAAP